MRLPKGKWNVSRALLWQAGLWSSVLSCIVLLTLIWFSGGAETQDAFDNGRRLLIVRETGEIQGKINSTKAKEDKAAIQEETPKETPSEASVKEAPSHPDSTPAEPPVKDQEAAVAPAEPPAITPQEIVPGEELQITQEPEEVEEEEASVTIVPAAVPIADANSKLIEKTDMGALPIIGADGTKSWNYYARPFERSGKEPMVAIIVVGLGMSKSVTEKALSLRGEISLSFSPYAKEVTSWANTARLTAHEKLVDLPMQANNYPAFDPGPYGLIVDKGLQENENRLKWLISRFTGHIGGVTPHNEIYTHNDEALKQLLQSLSNRGLLLILSREPARSETKEILEGSSTPSVIADTLVDEELLDSAIDTRLENLEQLAKKRGYAVGIVRATPLSLERLRVWSEALESRGVALTPVSAIVRLRFS